MQFQDQLATVTDAGINSFVTLEYFLEFAQNLGKSVREIYPPERNPDDTIANTDEYQRGLRYFKILSNGTNREDGVGLLDTTEVKRGKTAAGTDVKVSIIKLTSDGVTLLNNLAPNNKVVVD